MSEETWRAIPNIPEYKASSLGRIKRVVHARGLPRERPLNPGLSVSGYETVTIHSGGVRRRVRVHHLVCAAFNGPRPVGHQCAHGDGARTNNVPTNLRWATPRENIHDKHRHGTMACGEKINTAKLKASEVLAIRESPLNSRELAAAFGVSAVNIRHIRNRNTWKHLEAERHHV